MEKEIIKQFKKDAKKLLLDKSEKARMKGAVFSYVEKSPVLSSYRIQRRFDVFSWVFSYRAFAVYSFVFLILASTAVVSAAEGALPGDTLYAFKRNINEPVIKSLSFGYETRAKTHVAIAERRLQEVEKLVIKGDVQSETIEELGRDFVQSAESARLFSEKAKLKKADGPYTVIVAESELDAVADAHAEILKNLESKTVKKDPAREVAVLSLVLELENEGKDVEDLAVYDIRANMEKGIGEDEIMEDIEKLVEDSDDALDEFKKNIKKMSKRGFGDIDKENETLRRAEDVFAEGKKGIDQGDLEEAIKFLSEAGKMAREATVFVKAQIELGFDLEEKDDNGESGSGEGRLKEDNEDNEDNEGVATSSAEIIIEIDAEEGVRGARATATEEE